MQTEAIGSEGAVPRCKKEQGSYFGGGPSIYGVFQICAAFTIHEIGKDMVC